MARILVVDDDGDLCSALRNSLEGLFGHTVFVANDAAEALRLHKECRADLVVTDIFMPGSDGLDLIRSLGRDNKALKVIAMSGSSGRVYRGGRGAYQLVAARALGAMETLSKPFDLSTLTAAIDSTLSGHPAER
jgi:two-component system, NtrC family, response regulator HydG